MNEHGLFDVIIVFDKGDIILPDYKGYKWRMSVRSGYGFKQDWFSWKLMPFGSVSEPEPPYFAGAGAEAGAVFSLKNGSGSGLDKYRDFFYKL